MTMATGGMANVMYASMFSHQFYMNSPNSFANGDTWAHTERSTLSVSRPYYDRMYIFSLEYRALPL
jgi:hypothetical protein